MGDNSWKNLTVMAIDLEMDQPNNEIVQVGATVGNLETGEIFEKKKWYVKVGHPLNPKITALTGITDQDLEAFGRTLQEAYDGLCEMHTRYGCLRNPLVWGSGDSRLLRFQLGIRDKDQYLFGFREFDVKTLYQVWRMSQGLKIQAGLAKALLNLGLRFEGRKHTADDDSLNTFRAAYELKKKFMP